MTVFLKEAVSVCWNCQYGRGINPILCQRRAPVVGIINNKTVKLWPEMFAIEYCGEFTVGDHYNRPIWLCGEPFPGKAVSG